MRLVMSAIAVLCLICAARPAAAQANDRPYSNTPAIGGNGGDEFQAMCPGKSKMIGIGGRTGAWIDAMYPLCGSWDQAAQGFRMGANGPTTGGHGGGPAEVICPPRTAVGGWEIAQVRHGNATTVLYVRLTCVTSTSSGARVVMKERFGGNAPAGNGNVFPYRCPPFMLANGIYGRSGAFIDNAGLACVRTGELFPQPGR